MSIIEYERERINNSGYKSYKCVHCHKYFSNWEEFCEHKFMICYVKNKIKRRYMNFIYWLFNINKKPKCK